MGKGKRQKKTKPASSRVVLDDEDWKDCLWTKNREKRTIELWNGCGVVEFWVLTKEKTGRKLAVVHKRVIPRDPSLDQRFHHRVASYVNEGTFYVRFWKRFGKFCRIARPLGVHINPSPSSGDVLVDMVLEDLSIEYPRTFDMVSGVSLRAALCWLASYHAIGYEEVFVPSHRGTYWGLAVRLDEYGRLDPVWKEIAIAVDARLSGKDLEKRQDEIGYREVAKGAMEGFTFVHGDAKVDNFLFSGDGKSAAAVDFQYAGKGFGEGDVVQLLVSSASRMTEKVEREALDMYHGFLCEALKTMGKRLPTRHQVQVRYDLCLLDYQRFLMGWGEWGAIEYIRQRCLRIVKQLQATGLSMNKALDRLYF